MTVQKENFDLKRTLTFAPILGFLIASAVMAAPTESLKDDQFQTLQQGELENAAITSDGFITPSYRRESVGDSGAEIVWASLELGGKRGVLCATGHEGKLVRLVQGEAPVLVADLAEPELTALLKLDDGGVLVAASPSGTIYELGADDKLTTLTTIESKFIWDMEQDAKGNIWVATGDGGKLYKVSREKSAAKAESVFDSDSKNLLDIWVDRDGFMGPKGSLYLAGQNPGWLYQFDPSGAKGRVVFNAESDEIRAIQPVKDGLALALNSERAPTAQALALTLRMSGGAVSNPEAAVDEMQQGQQQGGENAGPKADPRAMGDVFTTSGKPGPYGPVSTVMLLTPEGFARSLWLSPEKPIHSLAVNSTGNVLVAAGGKGRIFEILPHDAFALVTDLKDDYVVRMTPTEKGWLLSAGRNGVVFQMADSRADEAIYRSRILDVKSPVKWGQFYWSGDVPKGQKVSVAFRTGATDDPEKGGWSDWSKEQNVEKDEPATMPVGPVRYVQYRLTLHSSGDEALALRSDYVEAFYQQQNRAPRVKKILAGEASKPAAAAGGAPPSGSSGGDGSGSANTGGASAGQAASGGEAAAAPRPPDSNSKSVNLTWLAEDANGDALQYALYYKADDEADWKLIQDEMTAARMPLNVSGVADGRYRFRVVASDALANPPGTGLEAELVSDEVVVDNTPPKIEDLKANPSSDRAEISIKIVDDLSLIASVTLDWDGGDAYPILPTDGFFDQTTERFEWTTPRLPNGEHVLTVNATDRRGNMSVRKVIFRTGK